METIEWRDFERVEIRVGRVLSAEPFREARVPAYVLQVDFGEAIGTRKSSAQITANYRPEDLVGRLVVGVVNFPPKQTLRHAASPRGPRNPRYLTGHPAAAALARIP